MKRINIKTLGRTLLLVAAFAFSVSAEEALFHKLNGGGGGSDLALLKVGGTGFGQQKNESGEGSGGDQYKSVGFLFPVKGDFYPGVYYATGKVTETRMLKGFDLIGGGWWGGLGESEDDHFPRYFGFCVGLGYMLGYDYNPVENLHLIIGSSIGFYLEFWRTILNGWDWRETVMASDTSKAKGYWNKTDETSSYIFNILAPTIKVQYSWIEISYRGLVGYYYTKPHMDSVPKEYVKTASGFDWTRHHLTIGFCFGRNT
jgi:hypothetical protein